MIDGAENSSPFDMPGVRTPTDSVTDLSESLFEIFWRRRWVVLVTVLLALAAGLIYLQRATPLYQSTSRIYVEQTGPQIFERDNSGMITRWDNYLYTQAERLKSTEILAAALKSPGMTNLRTLADAGTPVVTLRKKLGVEIGKRNEIINISILSPYPDEAAHIVNSVVDSYVTAHELRKRTTLGEVVRILKEERARRSRELLTKLEAMMDFKRQSEGLALGAHQDNNVIIRRLERLSTALTEAQLGALESRSYYEAAKKMAAEPARLRQLLGSQSGRDAYALAGLATEASAFRVELQRLERQRADSLGEISPDHPAVVATDAEIKRIRSQLAELDEQVVDSHLAVAEQEYLMAREKQAELQKYFDQQRDEAMALNDHLAQFAILQSDYQQTKELCDLLDSSIQRLDVTTEVGGLNISILEAAQPALEPTQPRKAKTMAMALCMGLFVGAGLALGREWQDQRLRSTQEISALLDLPVLGAIPTMGRSKEVPSVRGRKLLMAPDSQEAEAFRTVRTALFFGAPKALKTILMTSPAPGEGKSTCAANLGIAMAQAGQKVLIIDADLRRPMQQNIFELEHTRKGLTRVLAGEIPLREAIEPSGVKNLHVITTGPNVPNPAEMLNSESFRKILARLSTAYDRILVDSPPVVAVTDGLILAAICDVTVVVLRAQVSTRRVSMQARQSLASINAKVLGVVVNDVPRKGGGYGYYHYHGYHGNGSKKGKGNGRLRDGVTTATPPSRMTELNVEGRRSDVFSRL